MQHHLSHDRPPSHSSSRQFILLVTIAMVCWWPPIGMPTTEAPNSICKVGPMLLPFSLHPTDNAWHLAMIARMAIPWSSGAHPGHGPSLPDSAATPPPFDLLVWANGDNLPSPSSCWALALSPPRRRLLSPRPLAPPTLDLLLTSSPRPHPRADPRLLHRTATSRPPRARHDPLVPHRSIISSAMSP